MDEVYLVVHGERAALPHSRDPELLAEVGLAPSALFGVRVWTTCATYDRALESTTGPEIDHDPSRPCPPRPIP